MKGKVIQIGWGRGSDVCVELDLERSLHFLRTLVNQVIADSQLVSANSLPTDELMP